MSKPPPPFIPPDFTGHCYLRNGAKAWFVNGLLHRDGAPALIYPNGQRCFYAFGLLHNDRGAAVIHPDGTKEDWHRGRCRPHPDAAPVSAGEDRADRDAMAVDFANSADPWGMPEREEQPVHTSKRRPALLASKPEI